MYLLLSGEGPTDIGACGSVAEACDTHDFNAGPMTWIIDKLMEAFLGYDFSHIENERLSFVSESFLAKTRQRPLKKALALRGKKKPAETKYYYENARSLAVAAKALAEKIEDNVVAVLFRDSDGTASAGRGHWRDKRDSMIKGFEAEDYNFGVAMVPKPKSEAWLLCAVKNNPYQGCEKLENESGNDKSANPLKKQLAVALGSHPSTSSLNALVQEHIDLERLKMPSFELFKNDLEQVVKLAEGGRR